MTPTSRTCAGAGAAAAELCAVEKSFGSVQALARVDLRVERGEIVALLGPNGAGKSTALNILVGLRRPDRGRAAVFGVDPRRPAARLRLGCTPQETSLPPTLRVTEILELVRSHFRTPPPTGALLDAFDLRGHARRQAGGLSGGERRRLAVALAFAADAELVVLDEPTTGLDVASRRVVWDAVRGHAGTERSVLLTTHYLEEAAELATRVVVLANGRVLADGSVEEIRRRAGLTRIRVDGRLPELPGVVRRENGSHATTLFVREAAPVVRALVATASPLDGIEIAPASLEEAFLDLTGPRRCD